MKGRGPSRRPWLLAGGGMLVAVLLGVALGSGGDETPASSAMLNRIADRNQDAAIDAAARMKAESETSSRAADARQDATDETNFVAEAANTQADR